MSFVSLRRALVAAAALSLVPASVALAGGTAKVTMDEFSLKSSPKSISAGKVKFSVKNAGDDEHELVILKTKTSASKLKVRGGRASESGEVAELDDIEGGKTKSKTVSLKQGHYVLLCNLPGHYGLGMRADFTVK